MLVARVVSADQSYVGLGVLGGGAEPIDAARPGTVRLIVPGLDGIATGRFAYLPDAAVEAMATRTAHLAPNLDGSPIDESHQDEPTAAVPSNPAANPTRRIPTTRSEAGAAEPPVSRRPLIRLHSLFVEATKARPGSSAPPILRFAKTRTHPRSSPQ